MCVARYAQITQNNNFAISWWYLKKEVNDEYDFFASGKHESFWYYDFWWVRPKSEMLEMKLNFCLQVNITFTTSWLHHFGLQSLLQIL